jgi:hypothetical protein
MWGRATLTAVASSIAIELAATVATRAMRPRDERRTSASAWARSVGGGEPAGSTGGIVPSTVPGRKGADLTRR